MLRQPGQQPGLHQRRLAAARGAVDQADPERRVESVDSIRVFQNRRLSGRPSRSRGPGKSSRKNSASCRSNDRSPLGTTLTWSGRNPTPWPCEESGSRRPGPRSGRRSPPPDAASCLEEVVQVLGHVPGRAVPLRDPLRKRLLADPFQLPGDRVVDLPRGARLGGGDLLQDRGVGVAPERPAARQELVEDDAQAEDVGPAVDQMALAPGLFRAHVSRTCRRSRRPCRTPRP